MSDEIRLAYRV